MRSYFVFIVSVSFFNACLIYSVFFSEYVHTRVFKNLNRCYCFGLTWSHFVSLRHLDFSFPDAFHNVVEVYNYMYFSALPLVQRLFPSFLIVFMFWVGVAATARCPGGRQGRDNGNNGAYPGCSQEGTNGNRPVWSVERHDTSA